MKKRILKIRSYNMANFSAGSGEIFTMSLLAIIPAAVAQIVTWIVYSVLSVNVKYKEKAKTFLTVSLVVGTVLCSIAAAGFLLLTFFCVFSYFYNMYWACVVLFLAAVIPVAPYFLSLGLGRRYIKKHAPCHYKKPLKVIIFSFIGALLFSELLLGVVILLFSDF